MAYNEDDGLVTMALAVQSALDGLVTLFTIYPAEDAMNPAAQVCWDSIEGGETTMILSTADGLSCMWTSPEGSVWCGSINGNVWTTAQKFAFAEPADLGGLEWEGPEEEDERFRWQIASLPEIPEVRYASVSAIWGVSDSSVFAGTFEGPIFHWNGSEWKRAAGDDTSASEGLIEIHGTSESNAYAVGHSGRILHWDGERWSACQMPSGYRVGNVLTGVRVLSSGQAIVVDLDGNVLLGDAKTGFRIAVPATPGRDLRGIARIGGKLIFASSLGAFEYTGKEVVTLKSGFMANRVFETPEKLFFIESEQEPDPRVVEYTPNSSRAWTRRVF